ncbi:hypothetical protein GPJ56_000517 [Histomonas meleagridis]|uniref:uncharacterized protein n=1 Tax=Histomonas meleagridis TaxID=135588 RepID=UPI0035594BD3|nr:hypothetical protein GPJ56_000517 [Histomonas meleagridis]KAH0796443.1 hypothetical protein GO595_010336 [Histomonas meleagridis]
MSSLLDFLLNCDSPMTVDGIVEKTSLPKEEIEKQLNQLLNDGSIRSRTFNRDPPVSVFWPSSLIPFIEQNPIITNPFNSPFDHQEILERLTDSQLQHEKTWLQTKLRKLNSEFENLQHLAKTKITDEEEANLESLASKWMSAIHEMLWNLESKMKKMNPDINMTKLLNELRIDPKSVNWDPDEEDFIE